MQEDSQQDPSTGVATFTRKQPLMMATIVEPEQVIVNLIPAAEHVTRTTTVDSFTPRGSINRGCGLTGKVLMRKGSDTAELVSNEQALACSDSDQRLGSIGGGINNPGSGETTFTSICSSTLSIDEIPYMDHTSSSGDDDGVS